jgi:hypothetical protein
MGHFGDEMPMHVGALFSEMSHKFLCPTMCSLNTLENCEEFFTSVSQFRFLASFNSSS